MMRNSRTLLISVLISGCASVEASPKAPTKTIGQYYKEAFDRHYPVSISGRRESTDSANALRRIQVLRASNDVTMSGHQRGFFLGTVETTKPFRNIWIAKTTSGLKKSASIKVLCKLSTLVKVSE